MTASISGEYFNNHTTAKLEYLQHIAENATLLLDQGQPKVYLEHVEVIAIVITAELDALNYALKRANIVWTDPLQRSDRSVHIAQIESCIRRARNHPLASQAIKKAFDEALKELVEFQIQYSGVIGG